MVVDAEALRATVVRADGAAPPDDGFDDGVEERLDRLGRTIVRNARSAAPRDRPSPEP